jgi:hypothetical protein
MKRAQALLLTSLCLIFGAVSSASASVVVFDIAYSGASFSNTAVATGQISIDTALLPNPGSTVFGPFSSIVTDLSLTVSGATSGNGTFGLADFGTGWIWDTGGVTLNLATELVGQGGWGDANGDFNLFGSTPGSGSPLGTERFELTTNGGAGDKMLLTSFAPAAVPEPSRMLLGALGSLGLLLRRRRSR